jgi:uncharacterized Ntn-hydrolase superfamily protein
MQLSTFSIAAFDPDDRAWGLAVASRFLAAGAVVPWVSAGKGAVATQSFANTTFGPLGLELMAAGLPAAQVLQRLLKDDPDRELRQVGLVDLQGQPATFTGKDCYAWAGGLTGQHFAVQGNLLAGEAVIQAMAAGHTSTGGDLADRLLAALLAGDRAGGDRRGRQSAAIYVAREGAGYAGLNDRWLDYRVDDHPNPVPRLIELVELHRLYFGHSPAEEQLAIQDQVALHLQKMMIGLGYYHGPAHGVYDEDTRRSLREFLGNENFEDRTDFQLGRIDPPVYAHLTNTYADFI